MKKFNYDQNSEISIGDILTHLKMDWKFLLTTITLFLVVIFSYNALRTKTLKSKLILGKPESSKLLELKKGSLINISKERVFQDIVKSLSNHYYIFEFYNNNKELFKKYIIDDKKLANNLESITSNFKLTNNKDYDSLTVEFKYPETVDGNNLLNAYIEFTIKKIKQSYINEHTEQKKYFIDNLNNDHQLKKRMYTTTKQVNLTKLNEAIQIAKKIGLKKPFDLTNAPKADKSRTILKAEINNQIKPMYYRGYKALTAERQALINRENDDLYIADIADYKSKIAYYKKLNLTPNKISLIQWKISAYQIPTPPNKIFFYFSIILIISTIFTLLIYFIAKSFFARD
ncbi:hypothetical protein [Zooshikella sp. RANM57]|uniref:hypothetical protein n=1 Tax=Zooshikella sp. RANM57 TaxID=3425863 RepID=UPI003D6E165B